MFDYLRITVSISWEWFTLFYLIFKAFVLYIIYSALCDKFYNLTNPHIVPLSSFPYKFSLNVTRLTSNYWKYFTVEHNTSLKKDNIFNFQNFPYLFCQLTVFETFSFKQDKILTVSLFVLMKIVNVTTNIKLILLSDLVVTFALRSTSNYFRKHDKINNLKRSLSIKSITCNQIKTQTFKAVKIRDFCNVIYLHN